MQTNFGDTTPDASVTVPGVLMVTGVYYPEVSGASVQCRTLMSAFGDRVRCRVLTTTSDPTLPRDALVDGVPVHRVFVDLKRVPTKIGATLAFVRAFLRDASQYEIVHLHGFSQKSALLMLLARLLGKRVLVKMSSLGHDDPVSMRRLHPFLYAMYSRADRLVCIGPAFEQRSVEAGLAPQRLVLVPNGVDLLRFQPVEASRRAELRRELGFAADVPLILCVAFFSAEKQQEVLCDAWLDSRTRGGDTALAFVGAAHARHQEVDPSIADRIAARAAQAHAAGRLHFIEQALEIEKLYQAADLFVLPSSREGAPNVVLEAMACGLPCIASRIAGVTDALIEDGQNGLLVEVGDRVGLSRAIEAVLGDRMLARRLGASARESASRTFGIDRVARQYLETYRVLACVG
jgi:glycosyltransferase involved in cell wall biosynthesis